MGKKSRLKAAKRKEQKQSGILTDNNQPEQNEPTHETNSNIYLSVTAYIVPILAFLLFKCYSTSPVSGDENIYFYVGRRVFEGLTPYREIFLAHPPGHLLIAAIFMAAGTYSAFWLKLVSVLPALLSLIIVMRILQTKGLSPLLIAISGLLLGLSHNFLSVSTHFTGANWSMLFMVLSVWALLKNKRISAGLLITCTGLISFHIIPALLGILLAHLIFYRKESFRTVFSAALSTILVHLLCLIIFGDPYAEQVFGYHLDKTAMTGNGSASIIRFFHNEYHLATFALLSLMIYLKHFYLQFKQNKAKLRPDLVYTIVFAAIFSQIAGLFYVNRVFTYYLIPLSPLMVIASGLFLKEAFKYLSSIKSQPDSIKIKTSKTVATLVIVAICFIAGEHLESRMGYYKKQYGETSTYNWRDSACLPGFVNKMVKTLFFAEERRVGDLDNGLKRYLWHESVTENPQELLEYIQQYDHIEGTLFGDASTTPYFALTTNRKIALEQADTNAQLFKSGILDMKKLLSRLNSDPPAFVIITPQRGIASHPLFKNWVKNSFNRVKQVKLVKNKPLELYLRRDLK